MKKLDIGDPNATMIAGYFEDAFGVPPSQRTTRAVDGTYYPAINSTALRVVWAAERAVLFCDGHVDMDSDLAMVFKTAIQQDPLRCEVMHLIYQAESGFRFLDPSEVAPILQIACQTQSTEFVAPILQHYQSELYYFEESSLVMAMDNLAEYKRISFTVQDYQDYYRIALQGQALDHDQLRSKLDAFVQSKARQPSLADRLGHAEEVSRSRSDSLHRLGQAEIETPAHDERSL